MFHAIYVGSTSACFELENRSAYYAPEAWQVQLDGMTVREGRENVFSLFGLEPGRSYAVTLRMGAEERAIKITTRQESCAVSVKDFGARGDGVSVDTVALQWAVMLLPEDGRLVFPAGTYLTGPIMLKSHMTLELTEGAVLMGLTDKAAYPVIPAGTMDLDSGDDVWFGTFEGQARRMYASLLTAEYAEDIRIVGPGHVDGDARHGDWWQTFQQDPVARPRLLFFSNCNNVTVHGIDVSNSPSWHVHPYKSWSMAFYDVSVSAPKDSPNTDALDPESCDGVDIVGCRFSVGDDCVAIKSGKLGGPPEDHWPAIQHTIRNCLMSFGHGAIVLGSEISGGVKALSVSQCLFRQTDRGLRIKTRRGRGRNCDIDGIAFDNIRMEGVLTPIVMNMWYRCVDPDGDSEYVQGRVPLPVDERTPRLGRFRFSNMDCVGAEVAACYCDGLPEEPIGEVALENVRVTFSEEARPGVPSMFTNAPEHCRLGLWFENVKRVKLKNDVIEGQAGDAILTRGVEETVVE